LRCFRRNGTKYPALPSLWKGLLATACRQVCAFCPARPGS
jgi:hypothetical protein